MSGTRFHEGYSCNHYECECPDCGATVHKAVPKSPGAAVASTAACAVAGGALAGPIGAVIGAIVGPAVSLEARRPTYTCPHTGITRRM